jgi:tetratricopeptide (TPR) repeat protein
MENGSGSVSQEEGMLPVEMGDSLRIGCGGCGVDSVVWRVSGDGRGGEGLVFSWDSLGSGFSLGTAGISRRVVLAWLVLVAGMAGMWPRGACGQAASAGGKVAVGVIVTHTKAEALAALLKLEGGFNFGVLAREVSVDASAKEGGYLGEFLVGARAVGELPAAYGQALRGMGGKTYSGVVAAPEGFAILTVLVKAPAQDLDGKRIEGLVSAAHIRQSINVAGLSEEDTVFAQYAKPGDWQSDSRAACEARKASHPAAVATMEQVLATGARGGAKPIELMREHVALAELQAFSGEMAKSIKEWKAAYAIAQTDVPAAVPYLEEALGVSYLHLSEMENGVYKDSGEMDLFPPKDPGAHFAKMEDSKTAIDYLQKFLDGDPKDLQARWLLNLAYVTLGEYPAGVPVKELMSENYFRSKEDAGRFKDVAREAGLNVLEAAGGVVVDDFENNGRLDVITSSTDMCERVRFFHNNGDGTFTDRTVQAGLSDELGGLNLVEADYNNDGCMDFLLLRGGWEFPLRVSLLKNNCDGTFTDVTKAAGLDKMKPTTQTAAWADIDNDGWLDLFVGDENAPSHLFRNKGDGTFEDISHKAGVDKVGFTKGVVAADYDKDGYVDFYLSNFEGANVLYRNNHDGTFTDVAKEAGVQAPFMSFATWFFDYDNDGWPDLFVTSYDSYTVDQVMRSYLGLPVSVETLKLYRNMHDGTFEDVTAKVGLDKVFMPMGANFGDIDNDGFLDIYLGMGQPSFADMMPHVLLRNEAGKTFVDVTASSGTGEIHKGHGISFADLERDGHEDIVADMGGAVPGDEHAMRVFQNPGNGNDWINVKLVGVKSNRAAVGAEIAVTVKDDGGVERKIYRTVGDTSSFGGNPMEQHVGLGRGAKSVAVDVWWPASGTRQHFADVATDEFVEIKEFGTTVVKLERPVERIGAR